MSTKKKKSVMITPDQLKHLQEELKELNMQWVPLLVSKIKSDQSLEKSFKAVNNRKIYNVFNGIVKNGAWKLVVYKKSSELKTELEHQLQEATN